MDCLFQQKKSNKKKEWDKNFTKVWNKLKVGQQMKLYQDVFGEKRMKHDYYLRKHMSHFLKDGSPIPDKDGKPQKREWSEYEIINSFSIGVWDRRKLYDELVTKYNLPKLDRIVGDKLG